MGSIPLITSLADLRNLSTIIFIVSLFNIVFVGLFRRGGDVVLLSVALISIPFLPASNLFFPVGFVIAERVLYIPSMGFCLLVAFGYSRLCQKKIFNRKLLKCFIVFLISVHSAKTILRNFDWKDESSIFLSGLRVNVNNAKLWNNVGHALEGQSRYDEALKYFSVAAQVQPDDVGAHINVGRTLNNLGKFDEAEKVYLVRYFQLHKLLLITKIYLRPLKRFHTTYLSKSSFK
jgi:tetratricopeptide (TPR) repeat protein